MDLLQYRAMIAQEKAQADSTNPQGNGEQPNVQTQQSSTEPVKQSDQTTEQTQSTPPVVNAKTTTQVEQGTNAQPTESTPSTPQVFEINGQQVTLEELQKGYLRQQDYTKKTQDVARQAREAQDALTLYQQIQSNPELAEQLKINPLELKNRQLEQNYYDLMLQQEVNTLSTKYADFEVSEILDFALQHHLENLEDAYLLNKQYKAIQPPSAPVVQQDQPQTVDIEAIKAQIKAELLAEQNTSTIISTNGGTPPATLAMPQLSEAQKRVARNMKMSEDEYAKWLNKK